MRKCSQLVGALAQLSISNRAACHLPAQYDPGEAVPAFQKARAWHLGSKLVVARSIILQQTFRSAASSSGYFRDQQVRDSPLLLQGC